MILVSHSINLYERTNSLSQGSVNHRMVGWLSYIIRQSLYGGTATIHHSRVCDSPALASPRRFITTGQIPAHTALSCHNYKNIMLVADVARC